MHKNKGKRIREMSSRVGAILINADMIENEIDRCIEDKHFSEELIAAFKEVKGFIEAIQLNANEFSNELTEIAAIPDSKIAKIEGEAVARMNKLTILAAAIEDITEAGYSISSTAVSKATDVVAVMNNIVAEGFNTVLKVHKKSGEILGEVEIVDAEHHEVFGVYDPKLADALDRAFGLINQANDYGICFEN